MPNPDTKPPKSLLSSRRNGTKGVRAVVLLSVPPDSNTTGPGPPTGPYFSGVLVGWSEKDLVKGLDGARVLGAGGLDLAG